MIKLTQYSKGAGCGCKISPEALEKILHNNQDSSSYINLLVGNQSRDDAAVYDLGNGTAIISTTDFFMPIVDDAFDFGRIAAANAISDIYAMGGKPIMAVAILGWPVDKLPAEVAQQVISGGRQICNDAGIPLAGGHSIDSVEPIFGLAVTGIIDIAHLKKNNTARESDFLFLTKPLGTGIITTAFKRGLAKDEDMDKAIGWMTALNKIGEELGKIKGVNALTDITGFGLLGHLIEVCEGSGVSAEIDFNSVPLITDLKPYLDQYMYPDMTTKIFAGVSGKVNELTALQLFITCDPQTSGGLLAAVDPGAVEEFMRVIRAFNLDDIVKKPIGKIIRKAEKVIYVR